MFGIVFATIITLCHLYVFWRAATLPCFRQGAPRRWLLTAAATLWLLFLGGLFFGHGQHTALAAWLETGGMTWMGTLFLLTTTLLAVEIVSGGGLLLPRQGPTLRGAALLAGLILATISLVQGMRPPVVENYEVTLPGLPAELDQTVVVAVSDLHLGSQVGAAWLSTLRNQIEALQPDLLLLVGDIFEGHGRPHLENTGNLRSFTAPLGVWGVPGNHEFYGGPETIRALAESGVKLLRNTWSEVRPGLILGGVEDHSFSRRPEDGAGSITRALAGRPVGATILLSHKPRGSEEAAAAGVGLMISGHTHNGQLWPFNYLVKYFFPLLAGRYTVNNMAVLVCRGTGTWGPRMRLWERGEIMRITLRAGQSN